MIDNEQCARTYRLAALCLHISGQIGRCGIGRMPSTEMKQSGIEVALWSRGSAPGRRKGESKLTLRGKDEVDERIGTYYGKNG